DGIRDFHVAGVQTCALPISTTSWTIGPALVRRSWYSEGRWLGLFAMTQREALSRVTTELGSEYWNALPPPQLSGIPRSDVQLPEIGRAACREGVEVTARGGA